MGAFIPKWRPLDAVNSARLLSARPDEGGVTALCVSPALAGTDQAATSAIELARTWAAAGLRVLLADGTVGTPSLHVPFGLPNDRGLADVLLAGDGWESLLLPTGTPGLRLLPAGGGSGSTAPQDAIQQLARLCADTTAAGTLLVFFVPLGSMVTEWVFGEATDIVVLSHEGEDLQPFFDQDEDRIRALLGKPVGVQVAPALPGSAADAGPGGTSGPVDPDPTDRPRPPLPKRTAGGVEEKASTPAPRPERRPAPLSGGTPPTARIEEAWARAAAQLRARLADDGEAIGDLLSTATPVTPPSTATPATPAPTAEEPSARKAGPAPTPATESDPAPPAPVEPLPVPEAPPASKSSPPANDSPSASLGPSPPPRSWTPTETAPRAEAVPTSFAEPDLPPPLPFLENWDPEFSADEAYDRARRSRWRRLGRNGLIGVAGVALVAAVVVIRNAGRSMPPFEAPVTPFPRAVVDSGNQPDPAAASGERAGAPEDLTPGDPTPGDPASGAGEPAAATATPVAAPPTATPSASTANARTSTPIAPNAPHQRFSWSIAALGTLRAARDLSRRLSRAAPDQAFMVAPIVSNGRTLYRVLGGLSEDRAGLVAGRATLGERTRLDTGTWFVREAPSAFLIEEFDDVATAQVRTQTLWDAGIPVYSLVVSRQDGSVGYRLYAGAYSSEDEAQPLRTLLQGAGITGTTFTERRGTVPR